MHNLSKTGRTGNARTIISGWAPIFIFVAFASTASSSLTMPRIPAGRRGGEIPAVLLFTAGQAPTKKHFTLPIPPVPKDTFDALASRITKFQPWLGQKAKLDKAQQKAQTFHDTLSDAQETLKELEGQREEALRDVQEVRQSEIHEALQDVERKIQRDFDDSIKQRGKQWEKEKKDMEREIQEELAGLREKLEQELGDEQRAAETEEPPTKRAKLDDSRTEEDAKMKEEGTGAETPAEEAKPAGDEKEAEDESKLSFAKKQQMEELQKKADELVKLKKDMSWLVFALFRVQKKAKAES